MIDKQYGKYILTCDCCPDEVHEFDSWDGVMDFLYANDWKFKKYVS